jgi:hypothetical protein
MTSWCEIIKARCCAESAVRVLDELPARLRELRRVPGVERTMLLSHGAYHSDVAAVLFWHTDAPKKSREGYLLAEYMEKHGMVAHAVWILDASGTEVPGQGGT